MGLSKVGNTNHGNFRLQERTDLRKKLRKQLVFEASRAGKTFQNLGPGPLKEFVKSKGTFKKVKYYKGYIFVFQKTSTSLITMYPVPEIILEQQKEFDLKGETDGLS